MKTVLKYTFLAVFLISILFYNLRMTYSILDFSLNNTDFTEKYCENKDKPILKCNGKCALAKIAKATENQNPDKDISIEKEIVLFFQPIEIIKFKLFIAIKNNIQTKCKLHNFNSFGNNFHPPQNFFSFS